ncbi:trypco2 family protein [Streptomyces sp. URMC 123]|uniref:trypco2 family protein n=1 Tax=Streptomyces sp. URMC 123 TaxID=3423403 RepID=UPI003F1A7F59
MSETPLPEIDLADAVAALRDEVLMAAARASDQDIRFALGDIQLEFTVELRRDARARGGVRALVLDAGAEAARGSTRTHKVAFTLTPRDARTGGPVEIAAESEGSVARFGAGPSS